MSDTDQPDKCVACGVPLLGHEKDDELCSGICDKCLDEGFAEIDAALSQGGGA